MTIQKIEVGQIANDGTGDDLREAFIKVNDNFTEVDNRLTTLPVQAENLGGTGEGIFANKIDNILQFKEILAGSNTSITSNASSVIISASGGIDDILFLTDNGSLTVDGSIPYNIVGGAGIKTRTSLASIIVEVKDGVLKADNTPELSANLNAGGNSINNVNAVNANSFNGPLTGLVYGVDIREINKYFEDWDFGEILPEFDNIFDYFVYSVDVDLGSFIGEDVADFDIDFGTI